MSYSLGMPTLIELNNIEKNVVLCKKLNLDFVELNMNLPYCIPEKLNWINLKELKDRYNIRFTMHFPDDIDFGSMYSDVREANIRLFRNTVEFCTKVGIELINVHLNPGPYVTLPHKVKWVYADNMEEFTNNILSSFKRIGEICKENNVKLCVENMKCPEFIQHTFLKLREVPGVNFTYDIGHDAESDYRFKDIIENIKEKVVHMHLHDHQNGDSHKVLFDGILDINSYIKMASENNMTVVLEVKTVDGLVESVKRINKLTSYN